MTALDAVLPPDALRRALWKSEPLPLQHSAPLRGFLDRLHHRQPIVVTTIGQSNTAGAAGCFGAGCAGNALEAACRVAPCWGTAFMTRLNATWPHAEHALYNRAQGASNPRAITTCLGSHLAPRTDLLLVDFNLMSWSAVEQERLIRTAALLPRPPLLILIGLVDWCPKPKPGTPFTAECVSHSVHGWTAGMLPRTDPVGERLAVVARAYSQIFISMFDALLPLVAGGVDMRFLLARPQAARRPHQLFTVDGIHGHRHPATNRSTYYEALTHVLVHTIQYADRAYQTIERADRAHVLSTPLASQRPSSQPSYSLPAQLHTNAGRRYMLACYEWHSINLPSPAIVHSHSELPEPGGGGGGCGQGGCGECGHGGEGGRGGRGERAGCGGCHGGGCGWRVLEYTLDGLPRRKPGLVSTAVGDAVELRVHVGGGAEYSDAEQDPPWEDPPWDPRGGAGLSDRQGGISRRDMPRAPLLSPSPTAPPTVGHLGLAEQPTTPAALRPPDWRPTHTHRHVCVGLTYLTSYELMGAARVACAPPCECESAQIEALLPCARGSLFKTVEIAVRIPLMAGGADPGAKALDCGLRFVNVPSARNRTAAQAGWAKFRLAGVYTRRTAPRGASAHDCDADVGNAAEDRWWSVAINAQQTPGGYGWTKTLEALRSGFDVAAAQARLRKAAWLKTCKTR